MENGYLWKIQEFRIRWCPGLGPPEGCHLYDGKCSLQDWDLFQVMANTLMAKTPGIWAGLWKDIKGVTHSM